MKINKLIFVLGLIILYLVVNVTSQSVYCSGYEYVSNCFSIRAPSICVESYTIVDGKGYLCEYFDNVCYHSSTECRLPSTLEKDKFSLGGNLFSGLNLTSSGNISQAGSNFGTLPFGNGSGNISAGSGITSDRILGLSKDFFFKLAGLVILTVVALTVKPLHVTALATLLCYIVIIAPLKFFTIPDSLLVFITVVTLIELLRRSSL